MVFSFLYTFNAKVGLQPVRLTSTDSLNDNWTWLVAWLMCKRRQHARRLTIDMLLNWSPICCVTISCWRSCVPGLNGTQKPSLL